MSDVAQAPATRLKRAAVTCVQCFHVCTCSGVDEWRRWRLCVWDVEEEGVGHTMVSLVGAFFLCEDVSCVCVCVSVSLLVGVSPSPPTRFTDVTGDMVVTQTRGRVDGSCGALPVCGEPRRGMWAMRYAGPRSCDGAVLAVVDGGRRSEGWSPAGWPSSTASQVHGSYWSSEMRRLLSKCADSLLRAHRPCV